MKRNFFTLLCCAAPFIPLALIVVILFLCVGLPLNDIMGRETFGTEAQDYLDRTEPKILRATLAWAERENCLRDGDAELFRGRIERIKPVPRRSFLRRNDWSMLHYELREAMRNHARDRAEKELGLCRGSVRPCDERQFLPGDWLRREQLFEAHFRISRSWERPSRPLAHLKAEFYDLKKQLEKFMEELRIE